MEVAEEHIRELEDILKAVQAQREPYIGPQTPQNGDVPHDSKEYVQALHQNLRAMTERWAGYVGHLTEELAKPRGSTLQNSTATPSLDLRRIVQFNERPAFILGIARSGPLPWHAPCAKGPAGLVGRRATCFPDYFA